MRLRPRSITKARRATLILELSSGELSSLPLAAILPRRRIESLVPTASPERWSPAEPTLTTEERSP